MEPGSKEPLTACLSSIVRIADIDQRDQVILEELFQDSHHCFFHPIVFLWVVRIQTRDEKLKNEAVITEHIIFSESHLIQMPIPSLKTERITVRAIDSIRSGTIDGRQG